MSAARRIAAPLLLVAVASAAFAALSPSVRAEEPKPADKNARVEAAPVTPVTPAAVMAPATPAVAPAASNAITVDGKTCREQAAQPLLVRGTWFPRTNDADKLKEGRKLLDDAIRYRTEHYGYFEGFGTPKMNAHPPKFYAKSTTFMGLPIQMNEKVIPALKCVETALKASPAAKEYTAHALSGLRFKNTYRGVEVSNHVFGIAIDVDPDRNTCCGCVLPWSESPICKKKGDAYAHMQMPRSWVEVFERYGFYWLGHDVLQDTMHFEFLGDTDKIFDEGVATAAPAPAAAAPAARQD